MDGHYVINLGRQLGSGGKEIGEKLANDLPAPKSPCLPRSRRRSRQAPPSKPRPYATVLSPDRVFADIELTICHSP